MQRPDWAPDEHRHRTPERRADVRLLPRRLAQLRRRPGRGRRRWSPRCPEAPLMARPTGRSCAGRCSHLADAGRPAVPGHRLGHPDRRQRARDRPAARPDVTGGLRRHRPGGGGAQPGDPRRQRAGRGRPGGPARPGGDPGPPRRPRAARPQPAGRRDGRRGAALRPGRRRAGGASLRTLRDALAPGSYLVLSQASDDGRSEDERAEAERVYRRTDNPLFVRSRAELTELFDGFELVDRGGLGARVATGHAGQRGGRRARSSWAASGGSVTEPPEAAPDPGPFARRLGQGGHRHQLPADEPAQIEALLRGSPSGWPRRCAPSRSTCAPATRSAPHWSPRTSPPPKGWAVRSRCIQLHLLRDLGLVGEAVDDRMARLLAAVATGYARALRDRTLDEQESIRRAAHAGPHQAERALRASEARFRHQATHDPLTGLPNRTLFTERLAAALNKPGRGARVGVCFLDLDRFKVVNDTLGHQVGDQLLVAGGRAAARGRPGGHLVARLGGDEFVILVERHRRHRRHAGGRRDRAGRGRRTGRWSTGTSCRSRPASASSSGRWPGATPAT